MKKGHWFLTIALALLVAVPAFAQTPSVGVFFDAAGTQNMAVRNGGVAETHTAYVIAHGEMLVGGAAFKITISDPNVMLISTTYPAGVQIGDLLNGVEIGFVEPVVGYFGVPVRVATMTLFTANFLVSNAQLCVAPFTPKYNEVMVSDGQGLLFASSGQCGTLSIVVAAESDSWSQVKGLYR